MNNYIVKFEFRYSDVNKDKTDISHKNDEITLGIYEDKETAFTEGNKILEEIYNTYNIKKRNFLEIKYLKTYNSYLSSDLVTIWLDYCHIYCQVKQLHYKNILEKMTEVISAKERVRKFKLFNEQD